MTTLPQTTNVRLPRPPQGQIQVSGSSGPPGAMAPAFGQQVAPGGGNDAMRVIRSNWLMITLVVLVFGVIGYFSHIGLLKYYPRYTAEGLIEVQPQINAIDFIRNIQPPPLDPASTALEIRTHAQSLRSDSILNKVLSKESGEIRKTDWYRQFRGDTNRAKLELEDSLTIQPLQDTKLVKVQFSYRKPEDCKTIVQELISTYLEDRKTEQTNILLDRTSTLNQIKIKIEMRLRDISAELREKQVKVTGDGGNITFGSRIGVKEMELSHLVSDQLEAQAKSAKAMAAFEAAAGAVQQGQDPPGVDRVVQMTNPEIYQMSAQLSQYEIERELMLKRVGPEHSQYKSIEQRCDLMRSKLQAMQDEARAKARVMVLEQYSIEAKEAEGHAKSLADKVMNLKNDLGELTNAMMTLLNLQEEQRSLRDQQKLIKDQIENTMALGTSAAAAKVTWRHYPEIPKNPSFPKLPMVMGVAIGIGLALSLGVAFLRETMDQSIRTPRDIARIGQIQFLGVIPQESDDPQAAGARLPVVIFDAPHSHMAESFRHVRTRLQHAASLDTMRSLMVTSPSPGDGKTTVACNLAAGLALNGRRILLVDANFRRPEVHKVFGLANEQGFSDVLNAVAAFDEVIRETQVPNLAVMTAGPRPMNPTELFESQLLIDFIERALEEFDHVIFDGAPIMVVAEAQAMAPRVDGVISVVRARTNNRGLLQRMRDELRRTRAEHLGVVLNAVRAQGGGYYRRNIQTYYDYAANGHG